MRFQFGQNLAEFRGGRVIAQYQAPHWTFNRTGFDGRAQRNGNQKFNCFESRDRVTAEFDQSGKGWRVLTGLEQCD